MTAPDVAAALKVLGDAAELCEPQIERIHARAALALVAQALAKLDTEGEAARRALSHIELWAGAGLPAIRADLIAIRHALPPAPPQGAPE